MNKKIMTSLSFGILMVLLLVMTSGCGRKHIVSSPPTTQPARQVEPAPVAQPKTVKPAPGLIEDTYIVDAPKETAPAAHIQEGNLEDEPVVKSAPTAASEPAAQPAAEEPLAVIPGKIYYVQIGAFSDLENANKALARLISEGYKGSQLSKTDNGLFRVQAGAFPDKASANEALSKLLTEYPKGFVLSSPAQQ